MGVISLKKVVVTGGAGFIGSNLVKELINRGNQVSVIDDLRTGSAKNLENLEISLIQKDLLDLTFDLADAFRGVDEVYHFAANADVRDGWTHPRLDLEQNVLGTIRVLEACVLAKVNHLIFSSTGSIYGDTNQIPTPENAIPSNQTSLYSASKYAAESFIQAYSEAGRIRATIFRFVSVLGPNYSHGHVVDFVKSLLHNPDTLRVLGDGTQRKSYMHVSDCVRGVVELRGPKSCETFNLGVDGYCEIKESVEWITSFLGVEPSLEYTGGPRGWVGDNPYIWLDISKAKMMGWEPQFSIRDSIIATADFLVKDLRK
jgi:UDP-glucose 4-epimerase